MQSSIKNSSILYAETLRTPFFFYLDSFYSAEDWAIFLLFWNTLYMIVHLRYRGVSSLSTHAAP